MCPYQQVPILFLSLCSRAECVGLVSIKKPSILRRKRRVENLEDGDLVDGILQEMQDRSVFDDI